MAENNNENAKLSKLIQSRKSATLKAHKKRMEATFTRNKKKEKGNIQKRHRSWKEMSRRKKQSTKQVLSERNKLRQLIFDIQFNTEEDIREIAKKYYVEKTKGASGTSIGASHKRQEVLESLLNIAAIVASFEKSLEEDIKLFGPNPTDEYDKHDLEAGKHNVKIAKIVKEEAEKAVLEFTKTSAIRAEIEKKAAEAKMKTMHATETVATTAGQAVGAGQPVNIRALSKATEEAEVAAIEDDIFEDLLQKIKGLKM